MRRVRRRQGQRECIENNEGLPYRDLRNDRPDLLFSTCHISTGILCHTPLIALTIIAIDPFSKFLRIATCQYTAVCTPLKEPKQNPLSKNDGISVHPEYAVRLHSSDSPVLTEYQTSLSVILPAVTLLPHTSHATGESAAIQEIVAERPFSSAKHSMLVGVCITVNL